jgi:hypothetical protein
MLSGRSCFRIPTTGFLESVSEDALGGGLLVLVALQRRGECVKDFGLGNGFRCAARFLGRVMGQCYPLIEGVARLLALHSKSFVGRSIEATHQVGFALRDIRSGGV